ncbi:MAG: AAA family ATPase, partial [Proteobacteria bacterium]|nr:AAA family ATPase [Pseudomonadota bacterium]
ERVWALPVDRLSRGEKRRVALAGVLARRPEMLLLDEPSVGLDPEGQALVWKEVASFRARGGAVLVATHWPEPALAEASEVLCLDRGRPAFRGSPAQLVGAASASLELRELLPFSWRLAAALDAQPDHVAGGRGWEAPARWWLREIGRVPEVSFRPHR